MGARFDSPLSCSLCESRRSCLHTVRQTAIFLPAVDADHDCQLRQIKSDHTHRLPTAHL